MTTSAKAIQSVMLRRGMCYGECPVYSVAFGRDGRAVWRGEMFVERVGEFEAEVWEEDFKALARLLERFDFLDWKDRGPSGTDLPDYVIEVQTADQTKAVEQWGGSEDLEFWTTAAVMDGLAASLKWRPLSGG